MSLQHAPERTGQSDAMYEVVSLLREAERSNDGKGQPASPTEEEEADDGKSSHLLLLPRCLDCLLPLRVVLPPSIMINASKFTIKAL